MNLLPGIVGGLIVWLAISGVVAAVWSVCVNRLKRTPPPLPPPPPWIEDDDEPDDWNWIVEQPASVWLTDDVVNARIPELEALYSEADQ